MYVVILWGQFQRTAKNHEQPKKSSDKRVFAIFANFVKSATLSGLVVINITKNSEKSRATQKNHQTKDFSQFSQILLSPQLALI